MPSRLIKQFIYGSIYLLFLTLIAGGAYFIIRPAPTCFDNRQNQQETGVDCGGSCQDCALKNIEPISIFGQPKILIVDAGTTSILFQLKNSNPTYGAERFSYQVAFFNSFGEQMDSFVKEGFIYAGQIKTIIEPAVKIDSQRVVRAVITVSNPVWRSAKEWPQPVVQSRAIKTEIIRNEGKVTGLVLNNGGTVLADVEIGAAAYTAGGDLVAVSKTILRDLQPFEERAFTIFIPLAGKTVSPSATQVFVDARR